MLSSSTTKTNTRFLQVAILTAVVVLAFLIIFLSNSRELVNFIGTYLLPVLAVLSSGITVLFWRTLKKNEQAAKILLGFSICMALWAAAEVFWLVFILLDIEPYPSIADIFWVAGYFFLFTALYSNMHLTEARTNYSQRFFIFFALLTGSLLTFFFIGIPIVQDFSQDRIFEVFFNLAYPILDLILIYQAVTIAFISSKSRFATAWSLISLSFGLISIIDLAFSYGAWNGLYPSDPATLFTNLIDWGYIAFYPIYTLGIYGYFLGHQAGKKETSTAQFIPAQTTLVANSGYLVYTDAGGNVIAFSNNISEIKPNLGKSAFPEFLTELSGGSDEQSQEIFEDIQNQIVRSMFIKDYPLQVHYPNGKVNAGWLSGIGIFDTEKKLNGMNLLLRMYVPGVEPYTKLGEQDRGIFNYLSSHCGLEEFPFMDAMVHYTEQYLQMVSGLLIRNGGDLIARKMFAEIQSTIVQKGWDITITHAETCVPPTAQIVGTSKKLAHMLSQASEYAHRVLGKEVYQQAKKTWKEGLDSTLLQIARDYGLEPT